MAAVAYGGKDEFQASKSQIPNKIQAPNAKGAKSPLQATPGFLCVWNWVLVWNLRFGVFSHRISGYYLQFNTG
jgi:hypothetical protein